MNVEPHVLIAPHHAAYVPFFNSDERIRSLVAEAQSWRGTPWCANSGVRGDRGGVSCHNLPRAIYVALGALPGDFPKVLGTPNQANAGSVMEPWIDSRREFRRVIGEMLMPGDLLGLWLARDEHGRRVRHRHTNHLGIVLPSGWFVHVLAHKHTCFDLFDVSPWAERIVAAWRPVTP